MGRVVLSQDFMWHDEAGTGDYRYGEQGYLVLDGSQGRIRCSRLIEPKITSPEDSVQLKLRVVIGHTYSVNLYDSGGRLVVSCELDASGWVRFRRGDQPVETRKHLTYCYGIPTVDPELITASTTRESDEHTLRFGEFDFDGQTLGFSLDDRQLRLEGAYNSPATDITKIEVSTHAIEPGAAVRLRSYARNLGDAAIDTERFPWHWRPEVPPSDGYPYDHMCATELRPIGHRWLQTSTQYGWVKVKFPKIATGQVTCLLKTPEIYREAVILIEEDDGTIEQGCRMHAGILRDRFCCATVGQHFSKTLGREIPQDYIHYFEDPLPKPNQVYAIKVAWDARGYRIWIDGQAMARSGNEIIPFEMAQRTFTGIDTLTLHPGMGGTRLTLAQKLSGDQLPPEDRDPHLAYWGEFRVLDSSH